MPATGLSTLHFWYGRFKYLIIHRSLRQELMQAGAVVLRGVVNPSALHKILYDFLRGCVTINKSTVYLLPAAVLAVGVTADEARTNLSAAGRKKVTKAEKTGLRANWFEWNDYRDDLYELHNSGPVRQGKPLSDFYREYPPELHSPSGETWRYWGVFAEDKLVAYCQFSIWGNLALQNRTMSHKNWQKYGVMNYLFFTVACCQFGCDWYIYHTMVNNNGINEFKKNAGFKPRLIGKVL